MEERLESLLHKRGTHSENVAKYQREITKLNEVWANEEEALAVIEKEIKDTENEIKHRFEKNNREFARLFLGATNDILIDGLMYTLSTYTAGVALYSVIHSTDNLSVCKDSCDCKKPNMLPFVSVRLTMNKMVDFVQRGKASYTLIEGASGQLFVRMTLDVHDSLQTKSGYSLKITEKVEMLLIPKKI
jgi:hypothetical protein